MKTRGASWISFTLGALLIAGCGASASADASSDDNPTATTTSTAPATTTTTVPPPYSFDGSVPPPALLNTGTDYVAIYRSLSAYARWAESHAPDPTVADEVYVAGTATYEGFANDLQLLQRDRHRLVNVGASLDIEVASATDPLVSLRLTETVSALQLVDKTGKVLDSKKFAGQLHWTGVMSHDDSGRWRIVSVEPADEATRVQL